MQPISHQSDHMLVDAVTAGDKAPFAELVRRYEPVARAAAVAILRDTHLADDVLQETFLQDAVVGLACVAVTFPVLLLCIAPKSVAFNTLTACWQGLKDLVLLPPRDGDNMDR